jgi:hypothetical protein
MKRISLLYSKIKEMKSGRDGGTERMEGSGKLEGWRMEDGGMEGWQSGC